MIKKLIPILFIILFGSVLSIYLYASSDNIKVNKIVRLCHNKQLINSHFYEPVKKSL